MDKQRTTFHKLKVKNGKDQDKIESRNPFSLPLYVWQYKKQNHITHIGFLEIGSFWPDLTSKHANLQLIVAVHTYSKHTGFFYTPDWTIKERALSNCAF